MRHKRTLVYRVVTQTPHGWVWTCSWCHSEGTTTHPTWDSTVDDLMDTHTPQCEPYQRWFALHALEERRKGRKRSRQQTDPLSPELPLR